MSVSPKLQAILNRLEEIEANVADLCREAGIARSTFDRWVTGKTSPNSRTLEQAEDALARLVAKRKAAA